MQNVQLSIWKVLPVIAILIAITVIGRAVSVFSTLSVTEAFNLHTPVPRARKILLAR